MNAEHPPFLKLWTALPWLGSGLDAPATPGWEDGNEWVFGPSMIYSGGHHASLLFRARAMIALLSLVLALAVFVAARRLGGHVAGVLALVLYAFDPLVVAHAGLATTDLGGACFYFLATLAFLPAVLVGGRGRVVLAGVLLGLALASKFSNLPLLVVLAFVTVGAGKVTRGLTIVGIGSLVLVLTYAFGGPGLFLEGISLLVKHGEVGHPSYAFGSYLPKGRSWYFPAVWLIKTPIPILVASLAGIVASAKWLRADRLRGGAILLGPRCARRRARIVSQSRRAPSPPRDSVPRGARQTAWRDRPPEPLAARGDRRVLALARLGTLRVHPNELAYANEPAGGPSRLWKKVADSSVDWGQDLPALAEAIRPYPLRRLYLGYFGTAEPRAYGLPYCWTTSMGMLERGCEDGPDPGGREWLAISVTNLLDVYTEQHDAHAWLRDRPMTAFPGFSIALYDITGDARVHPRLGEVAMSFGQGEVAEPALRRALELAPEETGIRLDLIRVLAAAGRFPEALAECAAFADPSAAELCSAVREAGVRN
jgi:hypothetical protein